MDIRKIILEKLSKEEELKASAIVKMSGFSRAYVNRFFQKLQDEGKIALIGKANKAKYVLAKSGKLNRAKKKIRSIYRILRNKNLSEDQVIDDIKKNTGIFVSLPDDVSRILYYAFTEILNNAIEHSGSERIEILVRREKDVVVFRVIDRGIGIFNNIAKKKKLNNEMESIQDLLKGKQTTAPDAHSGEGIFFTSKVADRLIIQSSKKKLIFDNILDDIFIKDIKDIKGTRVIFSIKATSHKKMDKIFRQHTDDSFEFSKTSVIVKLYKMGVEYISRSQARRILSGLDNFKTIQLDFKNVDTVGQGFADEVFRVWKLRYPEKIIVPKNVNKNIMFMINRACK